MNIELILKRLPSYPLFQSELIESLCRPVTQHLLKNFGLEDTVEEDSDLEDLQAILFAFISSYEDGVDTFHRLYELLVVFPGLDFELVQSLLDSTDGKLSKDMISDFVELAAECEGNRVGQGEGERQGDGGTISTMSISQFLTKDTVSDTGISLSLDCHTMDRKTVLIITDDDDSDCEDGGDGGNGKEQGISSLSRRRQVVGVSMGIAYGLNALYALQESSSQTQTQTQTHTTRRPYLEWGVHNLYICCRGVDVKYSEGGSEEEKEKQGGGGEEVSSSLSIVTKPVYVTSVVYDYSHCLERMFDLFYYGWGLKMGGGSGGGGESWTPALEEAMLYLLISVDDDLVVLVRSWKSMMAAFESSGSGMTSDLENMLQMVQADATEALRTHSANAIGRLHQVLTQFAEMSSGPMGAMMNIPPLFLHCIEQFILAKLKAAHTSHTLFVASMTNLIASGKNYSLHLKRINFNANKIQTLDDFLALYEAKIPTIHDFNSITDEEKVLIDSFFDALTSADVKVLEALKPSQLDSLLTGSSLSHYDADALCYLPALSLQDISDPHALTRAVTSLAEKTYNDAITLGNAGDVGMGGYTMTPGNRSTTCAILSSLLNAGVAYVATKETAKLMGHLPMWRSTLSLQPKAIHGSDYQRYLNDLPLQLKKRIKDMKRIFRNKIKKKLSFRLNFDISHAVSMLREHHGVECWVGQELEQVWRLMATTAPPQLMIFELYYGDTLVAADFAHPICGGRTVYVATRFSARGHSKTTVEERGKLEYKNQTEEEEEMAKEMKEEEDDAAIRTMQPGFILALLECRWLQQRGCALWDLGGYNLSPLMQYKLDLAGQPQPRPHGLYEFRNCLLRQSTGAGAGSGAAGAAGVQHPWMESGAGEDGETTDTGAGGAGAGAGAGVGAGDVSAESLFSTVRSGDILIDDVKIEHLLGHSSTL